MLHHPFAFSSIVSVALGVAAVAIKLDATAVLVAFVPVVVILVNFYLARKVAAVHTLVNATATAATERIDRQEEQIKQLEATIARLLEAPAGEKRA